MPNSIAETSAFLARIPYNSMLGIQISEAHRDGVTLFVKVRSQLLNSANVLHGGVAASIADAAVGVSIQHRFRERRPITTVELKVNYFRPVAEGTLYARAHLLRVGSTLCVGRVDMTDDRKNLVAVAIVTYIFLDARGAAHANAGTDPSAEAAGKADSMDTRGKSAPSKPVRGRPRGSRRD